MSDERPLIWIIDSERSPLSDGREAFEAWAEVAYFGHEGEAPDWESPPDCVFFSAEIPGGPGGTHFAELLEASGNIPLVAVARLRSLAQAVAYFRAGAADYLSLPLDEDDARERFEAALERAANLAMQGVMVELESVDGDSGEISLSLAPATAAPAPAEDEDILARLDSDASEEHDEEPVAVDGLPIPTMWEELPCGLLVFDSRGNLVFSNSLGLELFGHNSLAELQETLENNRESFAPYSSTHHPLPENHWPHLLAAKTRTARSAVISIERPDHRRSWLHINCLPHLSDGKISRLSMTIVNLTGELSPLALPSETPPPAPVPAKKDKAKKRGKKRR